MALRQQVWVDRSVQGVLVGRVLLYWLCALLYASIGSACFQYNQNPEWTLAKHASVLFGQMWPWFPTVVFVLPLAIYDVVRLSNLFVGPIYRIRKHFGALRQDIACAALIFREDDYWRDLAAPINDMQAEILRLRTRVIELQQVAAQTSALLTNFKATPPDEQPITNLEAIHEPPTNSTSENTAAASPASQPAQSTPDTASSANSLALPASKISVADSNSVADRTATPLEASKPLAVPNAEPASPLASTQPTVKQPTVKPNTAVADVTAEVAIAPIPIASIAQPGLESPAAGAV